MAPPRGSNCLPIILLPHVPHPSGKSLPVGSSTHPGRPGTNGHIDGTVEIRPPSTVYECAPLLSRIGSVAGVVGRSTARAVYQRCACETGGGGRTGVTERAQGL